MKYNDQKSRLINSQRICNIFNNNADYIRESLRVYCSNKSFKGELLNAYNKSFIFTDKALRDYIEGSLQESKVLPTKYCIEFLSQV